MNLQFRPRELPAPAGGVRWRLLAIPSLAVVFIVVFLMFQAPPEGGEGAESAEGKPRVTEDEKNGSVGKDEKHGSDVDVGEEPPDPAPVSGNATSPAPVPIPAVTPPVPPPSVQVPAIVGPLDPARTVETLATAVLAGDVKAIRAALGSTIVDGASFDGLNALLAAQGFSLDAENAVSQIGSQPTVQRWAIHLRHREDALRQTKLEVDFARDAQGGWWPAKLHLPGSGDATPVAPMADPAAKELTLKFSAALAAADFPTALEMMDGRRVTPAALAGLVILLSEGGFAPKADAEIQTTMASRSSAWFIIPVVSTQWKTESQFGVILQRGAGDKWQVTALNSGKLLAVGASRLGSGDAAFTSYIRHGDQGDEEDALAVYFAAKSSKPDERGKKVAEIAAKLLAADPTLMIRLDGHGDAIEKDGVEKPQSKARAAAVAGLLTTAGINPERVRTETHGASRPRRANFRPDGKEDPVARAINRRVEIHFVR